MILHSSSGAKAYSGDIVLPWHVSGINPFSVVIMVQSHQNSIRASAVLQIICSSTAGHFANEQFGRRSTGRA